MGAITTAADPKTLKEGFKTWLATLVQRIDQQRKLQAVNSSQKPSALTHSYQERFNANNDSFVISAAISEKTGLFGFGSSPLVVFENVIINEDGTNFGKVTCYSELAEQVVKDEIRKASPALKFRGGRIGLGRRAA